MKNLVILHLESLSKLFLQMNGEFFPNINEVKEKCIRFNNYYATATSTAMVINDITYSDIYRTENTEYFGQFILTHPKTKSFIDELEEDGYTTLGVHYPAALGNEINPGHMYAQNSDLVNYSNYEKAIDDVKLIIDESKQGKKPFLVYFCNETSHICYDDQKKFHIKNPTERWKYGYSTIDKTVGDFFRILSDKEVLKDTVVLLYGDHGDDYYGHGYNGGYAHSIEPYSNIIHTPFFIYDESQDVCEIDDIICSLDIKPILYNLIGSQRKVDTQYIYDVFRSKREYVFSRNLFAGQTPQKINAFICNVNKSYAITTTEYTMILTNDGIRMYLNQIDPTCNNNILDFFILRKPKLVHMTELRDLCVHYLSYMGHGSIGEIQRNFRKMRCWMMRELTNLRKETGLVRILNKDSINRICYEKNMIFEFSKIRTQRIKKKVISKIGK